MRQAGATDRAALGAFLRVHASRAMFQLDHFLNGRGRFWVNDPLTDVLCFAPDGTAQLVFTNGAVAGLGDALQGQSVAGVVGARADVATVQAAFDLPTAVLDRVEGHYELMLDAMQMPDVAGLELVPYHLVPREAVIAMRTAYYIEALDVAPQNAAARAMMHVQEGLETGVYRVLMKDQTPLGLTGFNTDVVDTAMIGGVYTPPEWRGQGFAGKAIALHLLDAQKRGVKKAVLSAANEAAARAYKRIGFRKVGSFQIILFDTPVTLHG